MRHASAHLTGETEAQPAWTETACFAFVKTRIIMARSGRPTQFASSVFRAGGLRARYDLVRSK
jgi:hypothetical protein